MQYFSLTRRTVILYSVAHVFGRVIEILSLWTGFLPVENKITRIAGVGKRSEKNFYERYLHNSWSMLFLEEKECKECSDRTIS